MEFLICLGIAILIDILLIIVMWILVRIMEWEYRFYLGVGIVTVLLTTGLVAFVRETIRTDKQIEHSINQSSGEYKIEELLKE